MPEEAGLGGWLAKHGLAEADKAVPMLRGEAPATGGCRAQAFALINQALG